MKKLIKTILIVFSVTVMALSLTVLASCSGSSCGEYSHSLSGAVLEIDEFQHSQKCEECGEVVKKYHDFNDVVVTKEATKEVDGEGYQTCKVCNYRKEVVVPYCIHTYEKVVGRLGNCCTVGNIEHYKCPNCEKLFDKDHNPLTLEDVTTTLGSHSFYERDCFINKPSKTGIGFVKIRCDRIEECGAYLTNNGEACQFILPKLSDTQYYEITGPNEEGTITYRLTEEYVKSEASLRAPTNQIYIVESILRGLKLEYDACLQGHDFDPTSYEVIDNSLYYVCKRNAEHKLKIRIPNLEDGDYITSTVKATCTKAGGTNYSLTQDQWNTVLNRYEEELVNANYSLGAYSRQLALNYTVFVESGGIDEDNHPTSSIITGRFVAPTFDVKTMKSTDGSIVCQCTECDTVMTEAVNYSDGKWSMTGSNMFNRKYVRSYVIYGTTYKAPAQEKFNYYVDMNGGEKADDKVETEGMTSGGHVYISKVDYKKAGYSIRGVEVYVDGKKISVIEEDRRVEEGDAYGLLVGDYHYWKVLIGYHSDLDEVFLGEVTIEILWY